MDAPLLGVELLLAPPADEPDVPPALEDGVLGALLELEELELGEALELGEDVLGELLAPPEAEPDFEASLEDDPEADGLEEAPPEGDVVEAEPDAEPLAPEGDDGEVLLGEEALLELDEPGLDALLLLLRSPLSHAARPKATATAPAIRESFMCPPWLGYG